MCVCILRRSGDNIVTTRLRLTVPLVGHLEPNSNEAWKFIGTRKKIKSQSDKALLVDVADEFGI